MKTSRSIEWIARADDAGARADVVLGRRIPGLSRRIARRLAHAGALHIDDRAAPPSHLVVAGERLVLVLDVAAIDPPELVVLHVTDDFVYASKPAGVHTHRLGPDGAPTLADAVARRFPECGTASADPREGGAIHRLDRDTTGVTAFARNAAAWRRGRLAMADPRTGKVYAALVRAPCPMQWPPRADLMRIRDVPHAWWDVADLPQPRSVSPVRLEMALGHGADRGSVAVRDDGRLTRCDLVPLAVGDSLHADGRTRALFAVALGRGHRHQIRVHLAWLGLPIEGDDRYGASAPSGTSPGSWLGLHCAALDLSACCPGEQPVTAPPPSAFARRLSELHLQSWAGPEHTW